MTDHKFTDEEVIKALECCADATQNSCKGCPCKAKGMRTGDVCIPAMSKAAADLIKRQRAEIERLTVNMNAFGLGMKAEKERADNAIKEFAKILIDNSTDGSIAISDLPDLVKEMTEENTHEMQSTDQP